jgi:predicted molibdopterin-dependent oxidoreductase YjgC
MEVQTDSERVRQARKSILTMLIESGHHDCPVCDKGGECPLQDLAYEYGVTDIPVHPEMTSGKVEYATPLIRYWPERCILCHRCVTACRETKAIGAIQILGTGNRAGVVPVHPDTCRACGECLLVCPTGALTENLSRTKGRPWLVDRVQSTCPYCACGCQLELNVLDSRVIGVTTREGQGHNQGSLCVRGRFGYEHINSEQRLTSPLVRKNGQLQEAGWDEALELIARRLTSIRDQAGPESMCGLTLGRATNEEQYLFQKFLRTGCGTNAIHTANLDEHGQLSQALPGWVATSPVSTAAQAELILAAGTNLTIEAPIFANTVNEAVRFNKARLVLIAPDPGPLAESASIHLAPRAGAMTRLLRSLVHVALLEQELRSDSAGLDLDELRRDLQEATPEKTAQATGIRAADIREAALALCQARSAVVLFGSGITAAPGQEAAALNLKTLLQLSGHEASAGNGLIPLRQANNEQGSLDVGCHPHFLPGHIPVTDPEARKRLAAIWESSRIPDRPGPSFEDTVNKIKKGAVSALFLHDERPSSTEPRAELSTDLLHKLDFLVVQDLFLSEAARQADVVLPGAALAEKSGTVTNAERKIQLVRQALPPRGSARAGTAILAGLAEKMGLPMNAEHPRDVLAEIKAVVPQYAGVSLSRLQDGPLTWPCLDDTHPGTPFLSSPSTSEPG